MRSHWQLKPGISSPRWMLKNSSSLCPAMARKLSLLQMTSCVSARNTRMGRGAFKMAFLLGESTPPVRPLMYWSRFCLRFLAACWTKM